MKTFICFLLFFPFILSASTTYTEGIIDFSLINPSNTRNIIGNTEVIGNTVECVTSSFHITSYDYSNLNCSNDLNKNDNNYIIKYIDIDNNSSTFNSSTATIHFPSTFQEIAWVGLFWQGHINNTSYQYSTTSTTYNYSPYAGWDYYYIFSAYVYDVGLNFGRSHDLTNNDIHDTNANKLLFKINTNNYINVEADKLNYIYNSRFSDTYRQYGVTYAAVADITSLFGTYMSNSDINITVANLTSTEGLETSLGNFGAWTLVVVYKEDLQNVDSKLRNNSVYYGYKAISNNNPDSITLNDFMLPKSGTIESTMSVFAGEGEYVYTPDTMQLDGTSLGDPDPNNVFDARLSSTITRNPSLTNNNGIDIDVFDTSAIMTSKRDANPNTLTYSSTIDLTSGDDLYLPSMVSFTTELYVPKFCYDYAYKQQDTYFTEDNNGSHNPMLTGNVISGEDIQVSLYLKNLVDPDINVTDMYIDITDINTTQVNYVANSTKLARIGQLYPTDLVDGVDVITGTDANGLEYLKNINIGTIDSNEYFYTYYTLNPNMSNLNMPIKAEARYTIIVAGVPIYYNLSLGAKIPICSTSNFEYRPANGIFNIVHNNYYDYDIGGSKRYYNLPTQVTKREGNFKVLSMDPTNLDDLKGISTTVAVEMIDASAFHDTNASCSELASSISERIWVEFDTNASATLFDKDAINAAIGYNNTITSAEDFYANARQNAAFRISYPVSNDGNGSLVKLSPPNANGYKKIENFSEIVQVVGACSRPVKYPLGASGNIGIATTAAQACGNSGTYLSPKHIQSCMECIYGYSTKLVCSRDNFAIRPEALLMQIDDQNQTNAVLPQIDITTLSDSGSSTATGNVNLNLAAGYQYNIEVNATNHIDNIASPGYTKTFNLSNTDEAKYFWSPLSTQIVTGCNSDANKTIEEDSGGSFRFLNGIVDRNTSLNNVGRYLLSIKDTTWTSVDSNTTFMTHHTGPYFTANVDCYSNSSTTKNVNAIMNPNDITTLNGCNISSSHSNIEANIKYNDYNVTLHPYKFDLNATNGGSAITPTIGLFFTPVTNATPYIYIADINETLDENMSYHLNGNINALGENNVTLTNFVDQCYATPLDINITTSNRDLNDSNGNHVDYRVRFHDINATGQVITALDINVTDDLATSHTDDILLQTVQTPIKGYFPKDLNGRMQTRLNMNYARHNDTTINPTTLTFIKYQVNCTNAAADCTFNADLVNNKTTNGAKDLNDTVPIRHYYGRTHAPTQTIEGSDGNISMFYEVFCNIGTCDKTLLQDGINSKTTDDPRWFVNTHHTNGFGTAAQTATQQKNASNISITREANGNHPDFIGLHYNGSSGYTYKATMENNASGWLIYNKYNPNATTNEFDVEFVNPGASWAGIHETNTTTDNDASNKTSRRIMW